MDNGKESERGKSDGQQTEEVRAYASPIPPQSQAVTLARVGARLSGCHAPSSATKGLYLSLTQESRN